MSQNSSPQKQKSPLPTDPGPRYSPPDHVKRDSFLSEEELISFYNQFRAKLKSIKDSPELVYQTLVCNISAAIIKNLRTTSDNDETDGRQQVDTDEEDSRSEGSAMELDYQQEPHTPEGYKIAIDKLCLSNEQQANAIKDSEEKNIMLGSLNASLSIELGELKSRTSEMKLDSWKQQLKTLNSFKKKRMKLQSSNDRLKRKIKKLEQKVLVAGVDYQKQVDTLEKEKATLQSLNKQLTKEKEEASSLNIQLNLQLTELESEVEEKYKENQQQAESLEEYRNQVEELEELRSEVKEKDKENKQKAKSLERYKKEVGELGELRSDVLVMRLEHQKEVDTLEKEKAKLQASNDSFQLINEGLDEELKLLDAKASATELKNRHQMTTIEKLEDKAAILQTLKNELQSSEKQLKKRLEAAELKCEQQVGIIEGFKEDIIALQSPKKQLEEDLEVIKAKASAVDLEYREQAKTIERTIDEATKLRSSNKQLEGELEVLRLEYLQQTNNLEECKNEITALRLLMVELEDLVSTNPKNAVTIEDRNVQRRTSGPNPTIGAFQTPTIQPKDHSYHLQSFPKTISFTKAYTGAPDLPLGLTSLHIKRKNASQLQTEGSFETQVSSYAQNIHGGGFKINIDISGNVYHAGCTWLEVNPNDLDFQCGSFSTVDQPWGRRRTNHPIIFPRRYDKPPQVVVWLKRFHFESKYWGLYTYVADITTTGFTIVVESFESSMLKFAEVSWIACTADKTGVFSGSIGQSSQDTDIAWPRGHVKFGDGAFITPPHVIIAMNRINTDGLHDLQLSVEASYITNSGMVYRIDGIDDLTPNPIGFMFFALK